MPALSRSRLRKLGRFGSLLVALLALLVISPFSQAGTTGNQLLSLAFSLTLLTGVYSVSQRRNVLHVALLLAVPALGVEWISNFNQTLPLVVLNLALLGAFVGFVAVVIFVEILRETEVTTDTILGGIAVYLLITVGWTFAYSLNEQLQPGSYPFAGVPLQELRPNFEFVFPELLYFSFVTVTTLGYGDMAPTTPASRFLATTEAMVGQLYVAIFIARLVALQITHRQGSPQYDESD